MSWRSNVKSAECKMIAYDDKQVKKLVDWWSDVKKMKQKEMKHETKDFQELMSVIGYSYDWVLSEH